ncbi:unnamed protein product [Clonostachys rosea]|uniref:Protein kinase domain-containing protein n=1 Tax=Bionectria ochroleuca TaxID=29856 RepID=A0ABY6TQY6_BIOOC|nr:unnamed protein product [Clonostachys rosea]
MSDQRWGALQDYKLQTQEAENSRYVTHFVDDPDQPPLAPPRVEVWKTSRSPIGKGGQGQVYLQNCVRGGRHHEQRAVKTIPCGGKAGTKRHVRELETMVKFSHQKYSRYFVRMLGWYISKTDLCIAMEYFPEGDLQSYLHDRRLTEGETREVVSQVLQGLDIMHKAGLAHRDIKPPNILIQQCPKPNAPASWWVKLADFGISKRMDSVYTSPGAAVGTLQYMAPELVDMSDTDSDVDYQLTDIWAVGAMTMYILTGVGDFRRRRLECKDVQDTEKVLPQGYEMSPDGFDFVFKLTAKNPSDRPKVDETMAHQWVEQLRPRLTIPAIPFTNNNDSVPSSPDSLFCAEEEITSLETKVTATRVEYKARPEAPKMEKTVKKIIETAAPTCVNTPNEGKPIHGDLNASLLSAARKGQYELAKQLLDEGANLEAHDIRLSTALYISAHCGHTKVVELLADRGARVAATNVERWTPINVAACKGHLEVVKLLWQKGADISAPAQGGWTPLHSASWCGHVSVVEFLAEKGADIAKRDRRGISPVLAAASHNHIITVKALCHRGADLTISDDEGRTPLLAAASAGFSELVQLMISRGAVSLSSGTDTSSSLLAAAQNGRTEIVKLLCDAGADINVCNTTGKTAFAVAALNGHKETTRLLNHVQTSRLIKQPNFKPLTAKCAKVRQANIPRRLIYHSTSSKSPTEYLSDASRHKLFAVSIPEEEASNAADQKLWILHNGSSKTGAVLAAGGEIRKGIPTTTSTLDSIVNMAAPRGTKEAKRDTPSTTVLRAGLTDDGLTIIFRFIMNQVFEWRRVVKDEGLLDSPKEFKLYRLDIPDIDLADPRILDNASSATAQSDPLASFRMDVESSDSKTFKFHILSDLNSREALMALSTSLSIRSLVRKGRASVNYLRAKIGYNLLPTKKTAINALPTATESVVADREKSREISTQVQPIKCSTNAGGRRTTNRKN